MEYFKGNYFSFLNKLLRSEISIVQKTENNHRIWDLKWEDTQSGDKMQ